MSVVIPRNTTIPTTKEKTFVTTEDNQSIIIFHVYDGERAMTKDNTLRGKFELSGIALAPKGVPTVKVRFSIDQDGILHVSAQDNESGLEGKITITNDMSRFSIDEIQRMVQEAQRYKAVDEENRKDVEARNDIENLLYTTRDTIKKLQDSVDGTTKWLQNNQLKSSTSRK